MSASELIKLKLLLRELEKKKEMTESPEEKTRVGLVKTIKRKVRKNKVREALDLMKTNNISSSSLAARRFKSEKTWPCWAFQQEKLQFFVALLENGFSLAAEAERPPSYPKEAAQDDDQKREEAAQKDPANFAAKRPANIPDLAERLFLLGYNAHYFDAAVKHGLDLKAIVERESWPKGNGFLLFIIHHTAESRKNQLAVWIDFLLRRFKEEGHPIDIEQPGTDGATPLSWAIALNDFSLVQVLLNHGADINRLNEKLDYRPLFHALQRRHIFLAYFLMDKGADPTLPHSKGKSAIDKFDGPTKLAGRIRQHWEFLHPPTTQDSDVKMN